MTADDLLAEAASLWATTRRGYRDGMIAVGRLLLQYVRARLARGDGLSEADRRRAGASRQGIVRDAAAALGVRPVRANELIRLGATADLLAPDGGFGGLSFAAVRALRALVHRPNRGRQVSRVRGGADGLIPPSATEEWAVRPEYRLTARALVARAAADSWHARTVHRELRALEARAGSAGRRTRDPRPEPPAAPAPFDDGVRYTTGQVAKFCKVAPRTVAKWFDSGRLGGYRIPGSQDRRVPRADLIAFAAGCRIPLPAEVTGAAVRLAFGLDPADVPAGFAPVDAFDLGALAATVPVAALVAGDECGAESAHRAGRLVRARNPRAALVLVASEDRADEPFDPTVFGARLVRPLDRAALAALLTPSTGG